MEQLTDKSRDENDEEQVPPRYEPHEILCRKQPLRKRAADANIDAALRRCCRPIVFRHGCCNKKQRYRPFQMILLVSFTLSLYRSYTLRDEGGGFFFSSLFHNEKSKSTVKLFSGLAIESEFV